MSESKINIIFFGTPEFAKIILEELIKSPFKPSLVVTAPDKPVGRKQEMTPPAVKILAEQNKIPVAQPDKLTAASFADADLIIVAAYGKTLSKEILDIPKHGALNIHPSLLPLWRGPSPIQYAILNDDKETGVTIMLMDARIDHGPIVAQHNLTMRGSDLAVHGIKPREIDSYILSTVLAKIGSELLIDTIPKWISGEAKSREQIHENATYTRILTRDNGHIDWNKNSEEIERQIRAFTPWPGSFTFWKNKRLKITRGYVLYLTAGKPISPGQTFLHVGDELAVQTGMGLLIIEKLQMEGKGEMTIKEFLNGYGQIIGATLG